MKSKLVTIFILIMTTFYMSGCIENKDDAIHYFDVRYDIVKKIIDTDNEFQMSIEKLLSSNPDDTIDDDLHTEYYDHSKFVYDSLLKLTETALKNNIPVDENDRDLHPAYRILLETYRQCCYNEYKSMLEILKNPEEDADVKFNKLYFSASSKLNRKIDLFYESVDAFAEKHNVEINLKD